MTLGQTYGQTVKYLGNFGGADISDLDEIDCIFVHDNLIYVQDDDDDDVKVFDKNTQTLVTSFNDAQLSDSEDGIVVSPPYIFVVENSDDEILVFNLSDNSYNTNFGDTRLNEISGLAAGDGKIFVADESSNDIEVFSSSPPFTHLGTINDSDVDEPVSLSSDGQMLYVVERDLDVISIRNTDSPFAQTATVPLPLDGDSGVAVDDKFIYVIGSDNLIHVFDKTNFGLITRINTNDEVDDPACLAVDGNRIYVADEDNDVIQVFSLTFENVPTMSQWSLFVLALMMIITGIVSLKVAPERS